MKKNKIFAAAILGCFVIGSAFAQETIKLNEKSAKGVYLRLGGGYSFGVGKTSGYDMLPGYNISSVRETDSREDNDGINEETLSNAAFSLGKGTNVSLGVGYMFNANIGLDLSGNYLIGAGHKVVDDDFYKSYTSWGSDYWEKNNNTYRDEYKISRSCFSLTPAIRLVAPISKIFSVYARAGIVLPISDKITFEMSENYTKNRSTNNYSGRENSKSSGEEGMTIEYTPYFKVGYASALGVNFSIGKHLSLFGEVSAISSTFEAKKSKMTKWEGSSMVDGDYEHEDYLLKLDRCDIETNYLRKLTVDNNEEIDWIDEEMPGKDVSFSLPASSIGVTIGLAIKF